MELISKRRAWVCLIFAGYTILLSSSWNIIKSILFWYQSSSSGWAAVYASVLLGAVSGLIWVAVALAVAVPASLVGWIAVLVVLCFCGKPRRAVVVEGKKVTAEISGFVVKMLIVEGNAVAALCAVLGYLALFRRGRDEDQMQ